MYNIKLTNHVPVPQPVTTDYLICAHYYAAWKKGAAGLHNGFDDLHEYPERTPLAGYYDEEDPNYCDWEIKWAIEHGINCFIHCWYRYKDNVGSPVQVERLRCAHGLHEAFFHARYENMMKFAIMFETSPRWGATTPTDMLENLMPFWMENYFQRGNYLLIDNKPVLFNFAHKQLCDCFRDAEEQRETFDKCRDYCRAHGFDGMIFAAQERSAAAIDDLTNRGYDFCFSYNYTGSGENYPPEDVILAELEDYYKERITARPERYITTASCFADAEPRTTQHWMDLGYRFDKSRTWYMTPDAYRKQLRTCKAMTDNLPETNAGRKIIMIDNWNEWDEGHFVSPSHQFGFRYLQAIREELTWRDNLPDYRMPQDMGLSNFNHMWDVPDMTEICRKKFGVD